MARGRRIIDDSDDEFPDLATLKLDAEPIRTTGTRAAVVLKPDGTTNKPTARRRKLGQVNDSALLKPRSQEDDAIESRSKSQAFRGLRVELRTRKTSNFSHPGVDHVDDDDDALSTEEVTIVEDVPCDEPSEFQDASSSEDDGDDWIGDYFPPLSPTKPNLEKSCPPSISKAGGTAGGTRTPAVKTAARTKSNDKSLSPSKPTTTRPQQGASNSIKGGVKQRHGATNTSSLTSENLPDLLSQLKLGPQNTRPLSQGSPEPSRPATPPRTPPKKKPSGLTSPTKKLPRIPQTPHRADTDSFWSQDFIDDWNMEHSPRKLFQPEVVKSPSKSSPQKKTAAQKDAKKSFEKAKHEIAESFLRELDDVITGSQLGDLAASTGGIKIVWTNKLNTTAGRANWKRETLRSKSVDGGETTVRYRHYASIELAEKVIDDEHRLLNVIAHEFCHLANFMVNGVTGNPHGKEFKVWAAKCSRSFAGRGIEVTTKHSYDIDFKYVWECTTCGMEFKRHSKSINPERHRCGSCKSMLKQTKPVPRVAGNPSEYQNFMKDNMKILKKENPGSPQKVIMKLVADKWKEKAGEVATGSTDQLAAALVDLTLGEKK